jgi:DNA-binding NtrC family response regulator
MRILCQENYCTWENPFLVNRPSNLPASVMTIMLVSPLESDHVALRRILSRSNWRLHSAFLREEAVTLMRRQSIPVVICVEDSRDRTWEALLDEAVIIPGGPRVVVSSHLADNHLWAEVLQAGAYDFLAMPWEPREVLRVISLAWQSWAIGQRPVNQSPKPMAETCPLARAAVTGSVSNLFQCGD